MREKYLDSFVLQSIRKNLRGKAREILLTIGETAKPSDILNILEGICEISQQVKYFLRSFI